jgi:hypothetical protein
MDTAKIRNINELDNLDLFSLYEEVVKMRKTVLVLVQSYGYDANSLVSRTFEKDIESAYGRKILKQTRKDVETK